MVETQYLILSTQYYKINILQKEKDKLALVTESYG